MPPTAAPPTAQDCVVLRPGGVRPLGPAEYGGVEGQPGRYQQDREALREAASAEADLHAIRQDLARLLEASRADDGIVILDFWATWCGACRTFAPVYEAASEEHPEIVFRKVDIEAATQISEASGVHALPTVAVHRDSIRVSRPLVVAKGVPTR
jgi:thiol-disulfide isomerase/thioredoxin